MPVFVFIFDTNFIINKYRMIGIILNDKYDYQKSFFVISYKLASMKFSDTSIPPWPDQRCFMANMTYKQHLVTPDRQAQKTFQPPMPVAPEMFHQMDAMV
jgi:hypothetical protein